MPAQELDRALTTLAQAGLDSETGWPIVMRYWERGAQEMRHALPESVQQAAEVLDVELCAGSAAGANELSQLFGDDRGDVVVRWLNSSVARGDISMAGLLSAAAVAAAKRGDTSQVAALARQRIIQGPLHDALRCVPLVERRDVLDLPENREVRGRLEILLWEAGASALQVPELGRWVWGSADTFEALIGEPARGALRQRVLAARCLEVGVSGMPTSTDEALFGRTLQVLQPLVWHPEPLVSTHAARGLGLLAGAVEHLEGMLLDWLGGASLVLRQRAMTAFAALPEARLRVLGHELVNFFDDPQAQGWSLTAAAAGTPYLFRNRYDIWKDLSERIANGIGGSAAAKELAQGLGALWRGANQESERSAIEPELRRLRELARRAHTESVQEWRDWLHVIAATDPIEGAERDPLDLETGLENLVHLAAQYDDEEADARAARCAESLQRTFEAARAVALSDRSLRHRAAGMNALEGCARSLALRLWRPQLVTHPRGEAVPEPDLQQAWRMMVNAPNDLLDVIRERRQTEATADPRASKALEALEVLAVRLSGYALDAAEADPAFGPARGPTAHATCHTLRKLEGVSDGSRELPSPLRHALSAVFWRLVDTTQGTALGAVDDVEWLGPFAAWWALVIDRPALLQQLATALPMIQEGALEACCALAGEIRRQLASGASSGAWGPHIVEPLQRLHAHDTELAVSLAALARSLTRFHSASGRSAELEEMCFDLVLAAERFQAALANPVKALHPVGAIEEDPPSRAAAHNAPRVSALIARAIRARELSMLAVWLTSLGPMTSRLVERAVREAVARTPPPPPSARKLAPEMVRDYELVRQLGEGGVGKVWLVRRPGADRLFVLKIPKSEALANANDQERAGLLASFEEEANALAGLYHPNVANIVDRGVVNEVPFLVLELLIGADLKQYAAPKLLSLFECRPIVRDACAGLAALHGAKLVHRDIKPANIWLRLPLAGGESFDPQKHRDPANVPPLSAVVIDFGMVRPMRVTPDAVGRFVAGTPGYIAPDQVLDPMELDGRADVYALAGCIYNVTSGRTFFDDITSPRDRIFAHMKRDPFEDFERLQGYPAELARLMRAATALDPADRPYPMEFGRSFDACL